MRKILLIAACIGVLVVAIGATNASSSKTMHASIVPASPTVHRTSVPSTIRPLMRLNQLDCRQYASQQECAIWSYSTCSSAAMTEVINSYGHTYHIHDILLVEQAVRAITADAGLLSPGGIERTVARFGFSTVWGYQLSLDQIIATANRGTPVIVGFPPAQYAGGHLVVVTGGNSTTVFLADSSSHNRSALSKPQFFAWWGGFSAIMTPSKGGQA